MSIDSSSAKDCEAAGMVRSASEEGERQDDLQRLLKPRQVQMIAVG